MKSHFLREILNNVSVFQYPNFHATVGLLLCPSLLTFGKEFWLGFRMGFVW